MKRINRGLCVLVSFSVLSLHTGQAWAQMAPAPEAEKKVTTNDPEFVPLSEEKDAGKGIRWYWWALGAAALGGIAAAAAGGGGGGGGGRQRRDPTHHGYGVDRVVSFMKQVARKGAAHMERRTYSGAVPASIVGICSALLFLQLAACSDQTGTDAPETGGVSVHLLWSDPSAPFAGQVSAAAATPYADVCSEFSIGTVSLRLRTPTQTIVAEKAFPCSAHQGELSGIPAGLNYTLLAEATTIGGDSWSAERSGISVTAGQTTPVNAMVMQYQGTDPVRPAIQAVTPAPGSSGVSVAEPVRVTFTKAVRPSLVNSDTIALRRADNDSAVAGQVSYDLLSKTVTFTPDAPLNFSTGYRVFVSGSIEDFHQLSIGSDIFYPAFTTHPPGPYLALDDAAVQSTHSADLSAQANPLGSATDAWFEWGTDEALATYDATLTQSLGAGTEVLPFQASLDALSVWTTYYYRAAAENGLSAGTPNKTPIRSFTTGTGWSAPAPLNADAAVNENLVSVGLDSAGNAMALYKAGEALQAKRYPVNKPWEPAVTLAASNVTDPPVVAVATNGVAFAVWSQYSAQDAIYQIRAARYTPGSGWETFPNISNGEGLAPWVAVNASGEAVAVWRGSAYPNYSVSAALYQPGTGWSTPAVLQGYSTSSPQTEPQVGMDSSGNAVAVWARYAQPPENRYIVYGARYRKSVGWDAFEVIDGLVGSADYRFAPLAVNANGEAFAVWKAAGSGGNRVYVNHFTPASGWEATPTRIDDSSLTADSSPWVAVAIDPTGRAVAAWVQENDVHARLFDGSAWGEPSLVETLEGAPMISRVAMDGSGNAMAAWGMQVGRTSTIQVNRYVAASGWRTAVPLVGESANQVFDLALGMNSTGSALLLWPQNDGTGRDRLLWSRFSP